MLKLNIPTLKKERIIVNPIEVREKDVKFMKKYILLIITTILLSNLNAQLSAVADTVNLSGTSQVNMSLLANDKGANIVITQYVINNVKYSPSNITRTITNVGKIYLPSNGKGWFIPVNSYTSGILKYTIRDLRKKTASANVIFITPVSNPTDPGTPSVPGVFAYSWVGNIGNTGDSSWGQYKFKGLRAPTAVAELNGYIYATTGFVEGNGPAFKTLISNPKIKYEIGRSPNGYDKMLEGTWIVSDASKVYILGFDPFGYTTNGGTGYTSKIDCAIIAYDINDNLVNFSAGTSFSNSLQDIPYSSGIVITRNDSTQRPVRLEIDNSYLYVYTKDSVKVFNKTTGARVSSTTYTPTAGVISTYTRNGVTATMTATSVTYNGVTLATAYNSPAINNYKYAPRDFNFYRYKGCVYIGLDGSFWLIDVGNSRILHYSNAGVYLNQIAYVPMNYNCSVDRNDPTRVFAGFLEYKITYPNLTWELVNNWSYGLNENYRSGRGFFENVVNTMRNVVTVSGSTYALIDSVILYEGYGMSYPSKMKLTATGLKRVKVYDAFENVWFDLNGDEYIAVCDNQIGSRNILYKNGVQVDQSPVITDSSASYLDDANFAVTSDGHYVIFNNMNNAKSNYHLEWVKAGVVVAKAAKSITGSQSSYPTTDRFMVDGVGGLPASKKVSICDSIAVFMYSGEGFQNAQTTKLHIYKNKQFYRIIGKTYAEAVTASGTSETPKEFAGNSFEGDLVKVNGKYYYFFNDEHGGSLHCFIITGL